MARPERRALPGQRLLEEPQSLLPAALLEQHRRELARRAEGARVARAEGVPETQEGLPQELLGAVKVAWEVGERERFINKRPARFKSKATGVRMQPGARGKTPGRTHLREKRPHVMRSRQRLRVAPAERPPLRRQRLRVQLLRFDRAPAVREAVGQVPHRGEGARVAAAVEAAARGENLPQERLGLGELPWWVVWVRLQGAESMRGSRAVVSSLGETRPAPFVSLPSGLSTAALPYPCDDLQ